MLRLRASRSLISPELVDRTATPRPPSTRGTAVALRYTRSPGVETRLMPLMVRARSLRVLHLDGEHVTGTLGRRSDGEAGDVTLRLEDLRQRNLLLRRGHWHLIVHRRVGVADAGEHVCDWISQHGSSSPTRLGHARHFTRVDHVAETDPAEAELAVNGTCPAAATAAGVAAHFVLRLCSRFVDLRLLGHFSTCPSRSLLRLGGRPAALTATDRAAALDLPRRGGCIGATLEGESEGVEQRPTGIVASSPW